MKPDSTVLEDFIATSSYESQGALSLDGNKRARLHSQQLQSEHLGTGPHYGRGKESHKHSPDRWQRKPVTSPKVTTGQHDRLTESGPPFLPRVILHGAATAMGLALAGSTPKNFLFT